VRFARFRGILRPSLLAVIAGLGVAYAEPALAADPDPRDVPSIAQYVEMVPTSKGGHRLGRDSRKARLDPKTRRRIRSGGGEDAAALEEIVSAAALGAPKSHPVPDPGGSGQAPANALADPSAADVATDSDEMALALPGLLLLLTAAAAALAVMERRRGRSRS
jgi:hypothetical protein